MEYRLILALVSEDIPRDYTVGGEVTIFQAIIFIFDNYQLLTLTEQQSVIDKIKPT